MDRLETYNEVAVFNDKYAFTFQYGQIRNSYNKYKELLYRRIYIPVWIDQKPFYGWLGNTSKQIYIPVWIDQKLYLHYLNYYILHNLHSSMDRLETYIPKIAVGIINKGNRFIFQYGQIRNLYTARE